MNKEQRAEKMRTWRIKYPGYNSKYRAKWEKEHPNEQTRSGLLNLAIKRGEIERPKICSICGNNRMIHGHHPEPENPDPLNVIWLCARCHQRVHLGRIELKTIFERSLS